ncbi:replication-relaxation family protein [Nocardia nova]
MTRHDERADARQRIGLRQLAVLREQLSSRDLAVLGDLERFRLLTTRQLQRLHFTDGHATLGAATKACTRVLGRLGSVKLIQALNEEKRRKGGARRGSDQLIWQLTARGDRLLRLVKGSGHRKRYTSPSSEFVKHTLLVSELAVVLHETGTRTPIELVELAAEGLAQRPFVGLHGVKQTLKPDLHAITAGDEYEHHWFIEADRDTERGPHIQRKLEAYTRYYQSGRYQAEHGLFPSVLWVVPDTARGQRLARMISSGESLRAELFQVCVVEDFAAHILSKTLDYENPSVRGSFRPAECPGMSG